MTKKTIRVTKPMSNPHRASWVNSPIQSDSPSRAKGKAGSVGAVSTASRAANDDADLDGDIEHREERKDA